MHLSKAGVIIGVILTVGRKRCTRSVETAKAIIEVDGLVKKYGSFTAVNGVRFQVMEGEVFGLGPMVPEKQPRWK
jgi:ABC-type glutathione transport system ATPase component